MRKAGWVALLLACAAVSGCANVGLSINLPIGGFGGVGVSVDTQGRIGGSVGVGGSGVGVGVGGSGQLPVPAGPSASAPN